MLTDYNPMENRRPVAFHCLFTLHQPLSHIAESTGNEAALKTMPLLDIEGIPSEVPIYSGNAQRNGETGRRSGVAALFDALNVKVDAATHQTFYAGGYGGSAENDMDWEREFRRFFPIMSLLGTDVPEGVAGKKKPQMVPGRIAIGDAYLICYESVKYLYRQFSPLVPDDCLEPIQLIVDAETAYQEARVNQRFGRCNQSEVNKAKQQLELLRNEWVPFLQQQLRSATEWMTLRTKVRADSRKSSEYNRHLATANQLTGKANKKPDEKAAKATGQMIASSWTVQAGAQLYSYWCSKGKGITDIEEGALIDSLLRFSRQPYIGGQSSTGCGLCALDIWYESGEESGKLLTIAPGGVQQLSERAEDCHKRYSGLVALYREYLEEVSSNNTFESQQLRTMLLG